MVFRPVRMGEDMRAIAVILAAALLALPGAGRAQSAATQAAPASKPVTIEYYYRIKWGQHAAFRKLYDRNHAPVLKEMQRLGWLRAIRIDSPVTHMAGGTRWDLRVTLTYRDAEAAMGAGYSVAAEAAMTRLYPDAAKHIREEDERMAMLEEHWDVVVAEADG